MKVWIDDVIRDDNALYKEYEAKQQVINGWIEGLHRRIMAPVCYTADISDATEWLRQQRDERAKLLQRAHDNPEHNFEDIIAMQSIVEEGEQKFLTELDRNIRAISAYVDSNNITTGSKVKQMMEVPKKLEELPHWSQSYAPTDMQHFFELNGQLLEIAGCATKQASSSSSRTGATSTRSSSAGQSTMGQYITNTDRCRLSSHTSNNKPRNGENKNGSFHPEPIAPNRFYPPTKRVEDKAGIYNRDHHPLNRNQSQPVDLTNGSPENVKGPPIRAANSSSTSSSSSSSSSRSSSSSSSRSRYEKDISSAANMGIDQVLSNFPDDDEEADDGASGTHTANVPMNGYARHNNHGLPFMCKQSQTYASNAADTNIPWMAEDQKDPMPRGKAAAYALQPSLGNADRRRDDGGPRDGGNSDDSQDENSRKRNSQLATERADVKRQKLPGALDATNSSQQQQAVIYLSDDEDDDDQ